MTPDLSAVPTQDLRAVARQLRKDPELSLADLRSWGIDDHAVALHEALASLHPAARLPCVQVALAERQRVKTELEVTWTGFTESRKNRDTRVVLKQLIREAKERILLTLYRYDDAELMSELKAAVIRGVDVDLFIDIEQVDRPRVAFEEVARQVKRLEKFWDDAPGDAPFTCRVFYDARVLAGECFLSMHAKCIVVDGLVTYLGSANFTDRGTTRNIELGVVVKDESMAREVTEIIRGSKFVRFVDEDSEPHTGGES